jgi:hypothetical protein
MSDAKEPVFGRSYFSRPVGLADGWLIRFLCCVVVGLRFQLVCQHTNTRSSAGTRAGAGANGDQQFPNLGVQPSRVWQTVNLRFRLADLILMLPQSGGRAPQFKLCS